VEEGLVAQPSDNVEVLSVVHVFLQNQSEVGQSAIAELLFGIPFAGKLSCSLLIEVSSGHVRIFP
jgi:hypothetical protein